MKPLSLAALCSAVVLGLATTAFAAEPPKETAALKPDTEGFIRDWLMLAPIPLGMEGAGDTYIVEEQVKGEAELKPKAGDKTRAEGRDLTWKAVRAKDYFFDFNELLGETTQDVAGFMVTYVVSEKELTDVTLLIGSNDQGRVYLNGREVFKHLDPRTLEKDADKVEKLTLKQGVNTVVFKVINGMNAWQGCLRFTDKDGKPLTDLTVRLTP